MFMVGGTCRALALSNAHHPPPNSCVMRDFDVNMHNIVTSFHNCQSSLAVEKDKILKFNV